MANAHKGNFKVIIVIIIIIYYKLGELNIRSSGTCRKLYKAYMASKHGVHSSCWRCGVCCLLCTQNSHIIHH